MDNNENTPNRNANSTVRLALLVTVPVCLLIVAVVAGIIVFDRNAKADRKAEAAVEMIDCINETGLTVEAWYEDQWDSKDYSNVGQFMFCHDYAYENDLLTSDEIGPEDPETGSPTYYKAEGHYLFSMTLDNLARMRWRGDQWKCDLHVYC